MDANFASSTMLVLQGETELTTKDELRGDSWKDLIACNRRVIPYHAKANENMSLENPASPYTHGFVVGPSPCLGFEPLIRSFGVAGKSWGGIRLDSEERNHILQGVALCLCPCSSKQTSAYKLGPLSTSREQP